MEPSSRATIAACSMPISISSFCVSSVTSMVEVLCVVNGGGAGGVEAVC